VYCEQATGQRGSAAKSDSAATVNQIVNQITLRL
jgi:hypothetical protein